MACLVSLKVKDICYINVLFIHPDKGKTDDTEQIYKKKTSDQFTLTFDGKLGPKLSVSCLEKGEFTVNTLSSFWSHQGEIDLCIKCHNLINLQI